eukprot:11497847-Alexandrium_andersonii.AAC.1
MEWPRLGRPGCAGGRHYWATTTWRVRRGRPWRAGVSSLNLSGPEAWRLSPRGRRCGHRARRPSWRAASKSIESRNSRRRGLRRP